MKYKHKKCTHRKHRYCCPLCGAYMHKESGGWRCGGCGYFDNSG